MDYVDRLNAIGVCDCGHAPSHGWPLPAGYTGGTGYGIDSNGRTSCYACCADLESERMRRGEPVVLYLVDKDTRVTDWPGVLSFPVDRHHKGRHNIARTRVDVWFRACGHNWHGVNIGDSQAVRCRVVKGKVRT